jgi:hypothetical protein
LQEKWPVIWSMTREIKIFITLTSTARSYKVQYALYAQGREKLEYVNALRKEVGLDPISYEANKKKVTWTLKSRHIVGEGEENNNNYSTALDFVLLNEYQAMWSVKADTNSDNLPDYEQVGKIVESLDLEWGGRWAHPDFPHVQTKQ